MAEGTHRTELDITRRQPMGLLDRFRKFLGFPQPRKTPNIKVEILYSEKRDTLLGELQLTCDHLLVSDMYKVCEEKTLEEAELIVPLEMPERSIPPQKLYNFTYCIKFGERWQREEADYREEGCVHGRLTNMDVFCVIAEIKPEYSLIGPAGKTFVSEKDKRINIEFPENSVEREQKFAFMADVVDQKRFAEYKNLNERFRCIICFTNILTVVPSTQLQKEAQLTLPLDGLAAEDDYKILCLHWQQTGDEDKVTILPCEPSSSGNNSYSVPIDGFSGHCVVATSRNTPGEDIITAARHAIGRLNMCVLLAFIDFSQEEKVNYLLVDCVEFTKVDEIARLHERDMQEIKHSRSRDFELKDKAKIKISIDGSIKQYDKCKPINSFSFHRLATTNKMVIPFIRTGGIDCNIRFSWAKEYHNVYFALPERKLRRPKTLQKDTGRNVNRRSSGSRGNASPAVSRQGSLYSDLHPILTDKSLSALADSVSQTDWRSIGIELNFSVDNISTIFDKAESNKSPPGLELLIEWRRRHCNAGDGDQLINDLIAAFRELKRNDIADMIGSAKNDARRISRSDFDPTTPSPSSLLVSSEDSNISRLTDDVSTSSSTSQGSREGSLLSQTDLKQRFDTESSEKVQDGGKKQNEH